MPLPPCIHRVFPGLLAASISKKRTKPEFQRREQGVGSFVCIATIRTCTHHAQDFLQSLIPMKGMNLLSPLSA